MTFQFDQRNLSSADPDPKGLPLRKIGFCVNLSGEERLTGAGITRIWRRGNGNESVDEAIYDFRGLPGILMVADDLRIFGDTNLDIANVCAKLLRHNISIVDITHPEEVIPELQERARKALHASRPIRNHRTARRRGRMGGLARAEAAAIARATRCADDIAQRLCSLKEITWAAKLWVLGEGFTMSSIQRHYR